LASVSGGWKEVRKIGKSHRDPKLDKNRMLKRKSEASLKIKDNSKKFGIVIERCLLIQQYFYVQGIDFETGGYRFIGNYQPDYKCYALPMYDGAGWNTAWTWTYQIVPGLPYTANETHQKTIVAMGKVKVPFSGEHFWPCLVIKDYMEYSDNFGTLDTRWIYEWVVPGRFGGANGVAAAQSTNGASQNFMIVENFFKLSDLYVPGWDLRCPDFANTTIWPDTTFTGPFIVSSTITDSTGIGADSLFYKIDGGPFIGVGHDSINGDVYHYTIPQVVQSCVLGYLLWARDSFSVVNNVHIWNTDPICAPESTHYKFVAGLGIEELSPVQSRSIFLECAPSLFSLKTDISFSIGHTKRIELKIYDTNGRLVKDFNRPAHYTLHPSSVSWNGSDNHGTSLSSGIYFVELKTDTQRLVKSVVLIR